MSENDTAVVYPPQLEEMVNRIMKVPREAGHHKALTDYNGGWLLGNARTEYEEVIKRENLPSDPHVITLLCEIAVLRALINWHEIRDRPPPMPRVKDL